MPGRGAAAAACGLRLLVRPRGSGRGATGGLFAVEAAPQALESLFCEALGVPFAPSVDNPGALAPGMAPFLTALDEHRQRWRAMGLPSRAARFRDALAALRLS